jgi:hypothetical protein
LLLAVGSLRLLVLLLQLRRRRLSRLLLRGFIRRSLFPTSAHGPGGGTYRGPFAGVARNTPDDSTADRPSSRAPRTAALRLRGLCGGLLLRSLNLRVRGRLRWRAVGIDAGLLLHLVVAVELVTQLLIVILVVLGENEHADLLRC